MVDWLAPDQEGQHSGGRIELTADRPFCREGDKVTLQAEWIGKGAASFETLESTTKGPDGKTKWLESLPKPLRKIEREIVSDVWNQPLVVALLFGCLCAEWWLRRRMGLA